MKPQSPIYPPRRYLSAAERKREILAVAAPLFFSRGYEGTEMAEIAARAGVSRALLHRHFGGKQEILLAIVREAAELRPETTLDDPAIPLAERISANTETWLDHFEANPNLLAVTERPIGGNAEVAAAVEQVREGIIQRMLDDYLDPDAAPEPLKVMVRGYVALILAVAHEWLGRGRALREQVRLVMVGVLEKMLAEIAPALLGTLEAEAVQA